MSNYFREKVQVTVEIMADSELPLRERLLNAYLSQLSRIAPPPPGMGSTNGFSNEAITSLNEISEKFRKEDGPDGSARASIAAMSDSEVKETIQEICGLIFLIGR